MIIRIIHFKKTTSACCNYFARTRIHNVGQQRNVILIYRYIHIHNEKNVVNAPLFAEFDQNEWLKTIIIFFFIIVASIINIIITVVGTYTIYIIQ